jgi:hypothetical protein
MIRNHDEGVVVAVQALSTNKHRSTHTNLGVVIGVATVMLMASLIEGVRTSNAWTAPTASPQRLFYLVAGLHSLFTRCKMS